MKTKGQTIPSLLLIASIILFGGLMQTRAQVTQVLSRINLAGDPLSISTPYHVPVTLSATVSDASTGLPIGAGTEVRFSLGQPELQGCSGTVDAAGNASCILQNTQPVGSYTLVATWAGNANYTASSIVVPFFVVKSPTTVTYTGAVTGNYLDTVTLSAMVLSNGGPPPAGTVVHFSLRPPGVGQPELQGCSGTVDAAGNASCSLQIQQPVGTYALVVSELGDANYEASSTSAGFTVTFIPTSLVYTGPTLIANGLPLTVSARFTDTMTGGPISGDVISFSLGAQGCQGTTDSTGVAACTISNVSQPVGPASITTSFAGDANYPPNSTTSSVMVSASYSAQIQQPINHDGTSVFNVKRGVVPVKFTLTLNGVATCALPPATIAVTRTAGGMTGAIDEAVYSGPADSGSNFRIDSCQYVFNLSASALGAGTYRIDILINSQVVGSASLQLR